MGNKEYAPEIYLEIEAFIQESQLSNIDFAKWYYFYHLLIFGLKEGYSPDILFRLSDALLYALVLCNTNEDCNLYENALICLENMEIKANPEDLTKKKTS